jgi:hypothetical protein
MKRRELGDTYQDRYDTLNVSKDHTPQGNDLNTSQCLKHVLRNQKGVFTKLLLSKLHYLSEINHDRVRSRLYGYQCCRQGYP